MNRATERDVEARWNRAFLVYVPYILTGLVLAMTVPDSEPTTAPLRQLVDFVGGLVPSVDRLARLSEMPQMTRTFGAMMWLIQPAFTIMALMRAPGVPLRRYSWWALLFSVPVGLLCLLGLGVVFPYFFLEEPPEELGFSRGRGVAALTFLMQSRLGHGTLGSVMFAFSSIAQVLLIRSIVGYPRLVVHNIRLRSANSKRPQI